MVDVILVLLGISFILFFGFFAEFIFKKTRVPDVLFLIILGFVIGPHALNYVSPLQLAFFAPFFTTFALLFLLYDGAFNIDLASFAKGIAKSIVFTLFNFFVSVIVVSAVMLAFGFEPLIALLAGFIMGGVSSAFVIPILKQLNVKNEPYSLLTLESAITDVLCIVFALTVMEIIKINNFSFQIVVSKLAALFAIAGFIGIIAGVIWIFLVVKMFKEHKAYMVTIAYLILVFVITEFLNGNGAIAALFFGFVLKNSKQLTSIFAGVVNKKIANQKESQKAINGDYGISVTSKEEEFFYSQISFLLKTFFFVYIGVLISLTDTWALLIGIIISIVLMLSRRFSKMLVKAFEEFEQKLTTAIFARGLAAAAIAQTLILNNIPKAQSITNITYAVIIFTILLSSVRIFLIKKKQTLDTKVKIADINA